MATAPSVAMGTPRATRLVSRLAWSLWAVTMATVVLSVALLVAFRFAWPVNGWGFPGFAATLAVPFATVGAFVISRRPANGIGWILLALGLCSAVQELVMVYGAIAFGEPGAPLPGAVHAAWLAEWIAVLPTGGIMIPLFLLFPNGRLPGRRWMAVAFLGGLGVIVAFIGLAFAPGPLTVFPTVDNPIGLVASRTAANALANVGWSLLAVAGALAVASLAVRWRKAMGIERQQFKWLVAAGVVAVAGLGLQWIVPDPFAVLGAIVGFVTVPIAIGVAVLRYRLYDIDRLISRTVTYAIVIGTLGTVYVAGVFLFTGLLMSGSDLAVAASTLAVAALFSPLRRRVRLRVDRRFNRPRYDAQVEVERFASRLRTHVALDELTVDLAAVVTKTMDPSTTSLWLR